MIKAIQGGQVKLVLSEREEVEIIMFHLSRSENSKEGDNHLVSTLLFILQIQDNSLNVFYKNTINKFDISNSNFRCNMQQNLRKDN